MSVKLNEKIKSFQIDVYHIKRIFIKNQIDMVLGIYSWKKNKINNENDRNIILGC